MKTTALPLPLAPGFSLDRIAFGLLAVFVGALQVSIVAGQVVLTLLVATWAATLVRDRARPDVPPFFLPLAVYAGVTLLVSLFSADPAVSFFRDKQLVLFVIVPIVYTLAGRGRVSTIVDVIVSVGAVAATWGIIQFAILHYDNLGQRPQGTLGHYMTYSGVLMLVIATAAARLLFGKEGRLWPALVMPALVVALELTFGRSAWVGTCVAVGLLFLLKDFRLLGVVPVAVALLFALAPDGVANRMVSIFDLQDPTSRDRVAMLRIGAAMIADRPLTGVGPDMVPVVYPEYRVEGAVNETNPHLHNVPMHIAAERGLPALGVWLWFIGTLVVGLVRLLRSTEARPLAAGGLAAVAGMLAAGFFEYNFGDSEFLMLFLVLVTLPFAAARQASEPADA
ncbi:MAG: O-antigen ligase family protein [Acidimicrobiia bacterium]|nr:O-antigen ligase family protein [Acidimicrobiia bacterium]